MHHQQPMLLTQEELMQLTQRRRPSAICRALDAMGFLYARGATPSDFPRVARAHVMARLEQGISSHRAGFVPRKEPDFGVFARKRSEGRDATVTPMSSA